MARVGNWVSTWEREIKEKDFTSGIFAYAIEKKIITPEDFYQSEKLSLIINKIKDFNINKFLFIEWEKSYKKIEDLGRSADLNNIEIFLKRLEKLLFLHLSSQGYK